MRGPLGFILLDLPRTRVVTTSDFQPSHVPERLRVPVLILWILIAGFYIAAFGVGLADQYGQIASNAITAMISGPSVGPEGAAVGPEGLSIRPLVVEMVGAGLSLPAIAAIFVGYDVIGFLVFAVTGIIVLLRKSDEWIGIYSSLLLVALGALVSTSVLLFMGRRFDASPFLSGVLSLAFIALFTYLTIFPDGRFVPRWTVYVAIFNLAWIAGRIAFPNAGLYANSTWNQGLGLIRNSLLIGVGLGSSIYRYLRVSDPTQRQQTKWILLAFGFSLGTALFWGASLPSLSGLMSIAGLVGPVRIGYMLIPIAIGIAILRHRLWDIDVLINRGLVYSLLSGTLIAIYFLLVTALQFGLQWIVGQESPLAVVVSTLAIAALFNPLRRRIQNLIDRRLYRSKYDAARTLEQFGERIREQIDPKDLSSTLLEIIDQSIQPAHTSLWIRDRTSHRN